VEATDLCTLASTLQEHTDKKSKEETLGLVHTSDGIGSGVGIGSTRNVNYNPV